MRTQKENNYNNIDSYSFLWLQLEHQDQDEDRHNKSKYAIKTGESGHQEEIREEKIRGYCSYRKYLKNHNSQSHDYCQPKLAENLYVSMRPRSKEF